MIHLGSILCALAAWVLLGYNGVVHTRLKYMSSLATQLPTCNPEGSDYCSCALMRSQHRRALRARAQKNAQYAVRWMSERLEARGSRGAMYYVRKYEEKYDCSIDNSKSCRRQVCGDIDRKASTHRSPLDLLVSYFV